MNEPGQKPEETDHASATRVSGEQVPPMPGTMWLLGALIAERVAEKRMAELRAMSVIELRALWDSFDDASFCGEYDCAHVHAVLNEKGDGAYCAV